jgi:hypothetical protein
MTSWIVRLTEQSICYGPLDHSTAVLIKTTLTRMATPAVVEPLLDPLGLLLDWVDEIRVEVRQTLPTITPADGWDWRELIALETLYASGLTEIPPEELPIWRRDDLRGLPTRDLPHLAAAHRGVLEAWAEQVGDDEYANAYDRHLQEQAAVRRYLTGEVSRG